MDVDNAEPENGGTAVEGWADTHRFDDGTEQIRILLTLNDIPDATRSLAIGEALRVAQWILAESSQATATTN